VPTKPSQPVAAIWAEAPSFVMQSLEMTQCGEVHVAGSAAEWLSAAIDWGKYLDGLGSLRRAWSIGGLLARALFHVAEDRR
jgi:hypothetical protein